MRFIIITLLSLLLIISCSNNQKKVERKEKETKAFQTTSKKAPVYLLRYKFKKGDHYNYKITTVTQTNETLVTDTTISSKMNQTIEYTIKLNVKDVTKDSIASIGVYISRIYTQANVNGQEIVYDSKYIYSSRERQKFLEYESMKKTPFTIQLSPVGKIIGADDVSKIFKNVLEIQHAPDTLSSKTKKNMKDALVNGSIIPLIQQLFKILSEKPVGVDSSWQFSYPSNFAAFQIQNTATYRLADVVKTDTSTVAKIYANLSITWTGENIVKNKGATYIFSEPNISGSGVFFFDQLKGLLLKSDASTNISMSMVIEAPDAAQKMHKSTRTTITTTTNRIELL